MRHLEKSATMVPIIRAADRDSTARKKLLSEVRRLDASAGKMRSKKGCGKSCKAFSSSAFKYLSDAKLAIGDGKYRKAEKALEIADMDIYLARKAERLGVDKKGYRQNSFFSGWVPVMLLGVGGVGAGYFAWKVSR